MKEYTITRYQGPQSWEQAPVLEICEPLRPEYAGVPIQAWAQVCYDDEALHVHLWAKEEHIRAELTGLLDEICEDSCLEFFFSPIAGDLRYFNLECNPNGKVYLGMGRDIYSLVRFIPEFPSIHPEPNRIEGGWELHYSIPYSFIRTFFPTFDPKPGDTMRANCFKCGDKTEIPHCLAWNPVPILPRASFHNPEAFGLMHFE